MADRESIPSQPAGPVMNSYTIAQYNKFAQVFSDAVQQEFAPDVRTRNTYLRFLGLAADLLEKRIQTTMQWEELVREQQSLRLREQVLKRLLDWKWWLLLNWAICLDLPLDDGDRMGLEMLAQRSEERDRERASTPPELYEQEARRAVVHELDQARYLVSRMKARFQERNQYYVYQAFLHNLTMHQRGEKTADEVIHAVAAMFQTEHADFLFEFRTFLKL